MRLSILTLLILFSFLSSAQESYSGIINLQLRPGKSPLSLERPMSAFIMTANEDVSRGKIEFYHLGTWHSLISDHDPNDHWKSEPVILSDKIDELILRTTETIEITIHYVYAASLKASAIKYKVQPQFCEKPAAIAPAIWRSGLPDPKPGRTENLVKHCIVHHSAGSNFSTDFVNVIRNIYLLHTQSNGWDDIGYNYLIAQNGDLFIGRDPQGVATEDNVTGAHFCGKNTGTMGICLLGTYTDTLPSDTTFNTLEHLLTWKLLKENLMPDDSFIHPVGGSDYLPSIAGHRDGCATECPGEQVYQKLTAIKQTVLNQIAACKVSNVSNIKTQDCFSIQCRGNRIYLETDPTSETFILIYNSTGELIHDEISTGTINIEQPAGIYYVFINSPKCTKMHKINHLGFN